MEKVYTVDVALMDKRPDAMVGENFGWRLESIVFLELCPNKVSSYDSGQVQTIIEACG